MYVVLSMLTGWLVTELKEFLLLGGISNHLAFSLLKICLILFVICVVLGLVASPTLIAEITNRLAHQMREEMTQYQPVRDNNHQLAEQNPVE